MRTYTLAGIVILLIMGCTPEGEGGDATQGDATTSDQTPSPDAAANDIPDKSAQTGEACDDDWACGEPRDICVDGACWIDECQTAADCGERRNCYLGACTRFTTSPLPEGTRCRADLECQDRMTCEAGFCRKRPCFGHSTCSPDICGPEGFCLDVACSYHKDCANPLGVTKWGCFSGGCGSPDPTAGTCLDDTDCPGTQCILISNRCASE